MHNIEPFYRWEEYYSASEDEFSPFFGVQYREIYEKAIYDHYIHPLWDSFGSETLYVKVLYANYKRGCAVIELIGEWNDTLYNDIMLFKRNLIDEMTAKGINKFVLIGENVLNFHGSDDCYYEEWFDEVGDGWIAAVNFRPFVINEMKKYGIDYYVNFGGELDRFDNWRNYSPAECIKKVDSYIRRLLS
jgi:hypothetical protein